MLASACQSLLAWHASDWKSTSLSSLLNMTLLSNCNIPPPNVSLNANPLCKRLGGRTKVWSPICSARLRSSSLSRDSYLQRQGPSRVVARATDEDGESGSDLGSGLERGGSKTFLVERLRTTLQIYVVVWVYIFYFFGASAWDGKGKKR